MATSKNITMKQFNRVDYDELYPATTASNLIDIAVTPLDNNKILKVVNGTWVASANGSAVYISTTKPNELVENDIWIKPLQGGE